jgi:phosphoribosylanthranilate isomerase
MTRIKICGLTQLEDVIAAVHSGANALGLVFYEKSPRYVTLPQAIELTEVVFPFVTIVGLFVNPTAESVREVLKYVPLDVLQFHGEETPEFCSQFGRPFLKAIRVRKGIDLEKYAVDYDGAQGLVLDTFVEGTHGGTGHAFDWSLIPHDLPLPVILSGGLNHSNVASAIKQIRPYAVDVSSGVEVSKGIKDAEKISVFIAEVNKIDLQLSGSMKSMRGHRSSVR